MASMPITGLIQQHPVGRFTGHSDLVVRFSLSCSFPAHVDQHDIERFERVVDLGQRAFTSSTEIPAPSGRWRKSRTTPSRNSSRSESPPPSCGLSNVAERSMCVPT